MSTSSAVAIRVPTAGDVDAIMSLELRNRDDLERSGPPRPAPAWEADGLRQRALTRVAEIGEGRRYSWLILVDGQIAGDISLHHVDRSATLSAGVGYMVDGAQRGRGVATAALKLVVAEAFTVMGLHRLQGDAQPSNLASRRVLLGAGFREVGLFERYLWVDGSWRDHVVYELVAADFTPVLTG
ncbi:MAG: GNAT family N-acetyltransferase [Candidatus Dormibacteria bacterium]